MAGMFFFGAAEVFGAATFEYGAYPLGYAQYTLLRLPAAFRFVI
jgi:hypothetical protein